MGGIVFPLVVVSIFLALFFTNENNARLVQPTHASMQMNTDAAMFVAYRNAVSSYMAANPTYTGTIPLASLPGVSMFASLSNAGNSVTATGTTGRVITAWAQVSAGAVQQVENQTGGDASIGISNGSTWTPAAAGTDVTTLPLTTAVNTGFIVSVIQTGA
jgi:hypothetical protein